MHREPVEAPRQSGSANFSEPPLASSEQQFMSILNEHMNYDHHISVSKSMNNGMCADVALLSLRTAPE